MGFIAAFLAAVVVAAVLGITSMVGGIATQTTEMNHAKWQAGTICHHETRFVNDVQDQTHVVYACADGRAGQVDYGMGDWWPLWD